MERADCAGTVIDLSRRGAHVETARNRVPDIGAKLRLYLAGSFDLKIEVEARVVRHTAQGFGAEFVGAVPVELLTDLGG